MREVLSSPLAAVVATLLAYRLGLGVRRMSGGHALAQPVLVAIVTLGLGLWVLDIDYQTYLEGGDLIAFFLGPATVALAVPLYRHVRNLKGVLLPILIAIPVGAVLSVSLGYSVVRLLGGEETLALSMAPKSATTPVAIAVSEVVGGLPSLTAVFTVLIGLLGAVAAPTVMTWARISDRRARGIAMGVVSHGVGTSRSLADDETEGAFSGLAMGLSALSVSIVVPLFVALLG